MSTTTNMAPTVAINTAMVTMEVKGVLMRQRCARRRLAKTPDLRARKLTRLVNPAGAWTCGMLWTKGMVRWSKASSSRQVVQLSR